MSSRGGNQLPTAVHDGAIALLTELCAISSPSGDLDGLRNVAVRLASELTSRNIRSVVEDVAVDNGEPQPVLTGVSAGAGDGCTLVVGHLDTVLSAARPRVESGRLVATGALDMKGGLVTLLAALDLLAVQDRPAPADLAVVAVPDEEVGGPVCQQVMREWSRRAATALVMEPGDRTRDGETLVAGRRGLAEFALAARGRAAHSGLAYLDGRSALVAVADWCASAQAGSRPDRGETVNVGRMVGGDADFVDNLAACHDLFGTRRRLNVVPDRARAEGEARFATRAQGEAMVARLQSLAKETAKAHEVELELRTEGWIDPVEPGGPGAALAARAVALAARRGWKLEIETERGGISLPNFLARPGLAVLDGLGPVGGGMHTRDEFLDLASFDRRVLLLADLLAELA